MTTQVVPTGTRQRTAPPTAARRTTGVPRNTLRAGSRSRKGGQPDRSRIEGLDGLRAIAIAAVLVYHLRPESLPGGFLGVDVFFVVSGFLITTLLLRELTGRGRIDLPRFWLRRARRLLPALAAVVLVSVPAAWLAGTDLLVGIGRQTLGALTFSSNWLEIGAGSSYFTATSPQLFVNFWSLAVEEQFYLLWPVLLVVVLATTATARARVGVAAAVACLSALAMALLHDPGQDATRVYYGTDTHLFGLLAGAALAFSWAGPDGGPVATTAWQKWRLPAAGAALAGLVGLMLTVHQSSAFTFRGGILLACLLTVVLIAALLGGPGPLQRVMKLRLLEWLGQRSYGIYLWHWPVIVILTELLPTAHDSPAHWGVRALALALTLAIAAVSFRVLEQPVRELGFRGFAARVREGLSSPLPGRRGLARAGAVVTVVLVVATLGAIAVAPERSRTAAAIEAAQAELDAAAEEADVVEVADADWTMPTGEEITGFGDSIVVTSKDGLEYRFPGIMLDARSIRQWPDGEAAVKARLAEGTVRRAVFLDFGTNAGVKDEALVRRVLDSLGDDRMVVVVNLYGGSEWVPEANETLSRIVADYPNAIIADWHSAISAQPELLQADRIHPGIEGAHLYAEVLEKAFAELSERLTGEPVVLGDEAATEGADPAASEGTGAATDAGVPADAGAPADADTPQEGAAPAEAVTDAAADPATG